MGWVSGIYIILRACFNEKGTHRKRENAMKAVQAITIGGHHAMDIFALQVNSTNMLKRYAVEELHGQFKTGKNTATQLEFSHAVFTKVWTGVYDTSTSY